MFAAHRLAVRLSFGSFLLAVSLFLGACGGSEPPAAVATGVAVAAATPVPMPSVPALPTTAMMADLDLAGEPYSAAGDPSAPITVVEFSDFG